MKSLFRAFGCTVLVLLSASLSAQITLRMDSLVADSGTQVVMPITVQDFEYMITCQGSIAWDTNRLTWAGFYSFGLNLHAGNFNQTDTTNGRLGFAWFDASLNGETLADHDTLFAVRFDFRAPMFQGTAVTFSDTPTQLEASDTTFVAFPPTVVNGCVSTPPPVGILQQNTPNFANIRLLENPVGESIRIQVELSQPQQMHVKVHSLTGETVLSQIVQFPAGSSTHSIDAFSSGRSFAAGIYLLDLNDGVTQTTLKLAYAK